MINYGPGNWFGLPERGITENAKAVVSGLFGQPVDESSYNSIYNAQRSGTSGGTSAYRPTASTGGQILGVNDFSSLLKPAYAGVDENRDYALELEKQRQRLEDEARSKLLSQTRKSYNPFFSELSRQEAAIPGIENEYMGVLNQGYKNQTDTINRGQEAGLAQANASQGEIKQNQATSLRDLASNLSNAVNAFGQRLGQAGAGDSSAANMANFAYSKLANRNTADVMSQVRGQLAKVEQAKIDLVNDAKDKLSSLETWKANSTLEIQEKIRSMRDYINQARAQGKMALGQDEVNMIKEGFTRAQERLQQINDLAVTSRFQILQNAQAALADAQAYSEKLTAMGNTDPTPVEVAPVDSGTIGDASALPMVPYGSTDTTKEKGLWGLTDLTNSA